MAIAGLDVSYRKCRVAVVSEEGEFLYTARFDLSDIDHQEIHTALFVNLSDVFSRYQICLSCLEDYSLDSPNQLTKLAEAGGVAKLASSYHGIRWESIAIKRAKLAVANSGNASKLEVANSLEEIYELDLKGVSDDITDAMSLAHVGRLLLGYRKPLKRGEYEVLKALTTSKPKKKRRKKIEEPQDGILEI